MPKIAPRGREVATYVNGPERHPAPRLDPDPFFAQERVDKPPDDPPRSTPLKAPVTRTEE